MTASPFPLVEVEGPPLERGLAYGRQAGERIARGRAVYEQAFNAPEFQAKAARYFDSLRAFDAELATEIEGIARGADQPLALVVGLNARTELTGWDAGPATSDECTAALAMPERTRDGRLLHGQNWDWRPACVDTSIVLRIRAVDGPDILTFCEAGQLARHGFNAAGLALTANGLQTDDERAPQAVPSPFIRRRMLMCERLADAVGVIMTAPRSASHNLLLSQTDARGRAEAVNLETTPREVFWDHPQDGLYAHANHFKIAAAQARVSDAGVLRHPESLYRDRRVLQHLRADGNVVTRATFERAFADDFGTPHAVCRSPAPRSDGSVSATVASLIMEPASGRMWLAPAPYESAAYTCYELGA